ncbi:MAG: VCBS repeat-containing protein [Muribaculaceae bacterium]|nr:VCBS repeat-containing protein [Muribaculaceae bacterium]
MKSLLSTALTCMALLFAASPTGAWQVKQGPMMTKWANEINPDNVLPDYPRPQMERGKWLNLNGIWDLRKGKKGENYSASFTYDQEILVPFPLESALSGVMEKSDEQCYWYKRNFEVPASFDGDRILLNFGAVDWETKVYVNGKLVGSHTGGYDPFSFDITDALNPSGPQELAVYVYDNTGSEGQPTGKQSKNPSICWYTAVSGIWQTVWIEPVASSYIADFELEPNLNQKKLYITVNAGGSDANLTFEASVFNKEGEKVGTISNVKPGVATAIDFSGDVKPWSPESPYLYDLKINLLKDGKVVDTVDSYCAMRKIEVKKDNNNIPRIYLNDNQIFQMGPLDQGWWPDGLYTPPSDDALLYDIKVMKDLGFNMVRKHIKIEPARWYYYCDKEGLLVWQDLPSPNIVAGHEEFAKSNFEAESENIVKALKNFPSIIHWVVFNEGWGQFDTERMTQRVDSWVNRLSPSRFGKTSLICCASGWTDYEIGDIRDSHSYPWPSCPSATNRAAVCGEYGGITLKIPGHIWPGGDFQYTTVEAPEDFTAYFGNLCKEIKNLYLDGLNAAVYTQIADVEIEKNGIMTYDRKVMKPYSPYGELKNQIVECVNLPQTNLMVKTILSTARDHKYKWRYTLDNVPRHWNEPGFNDSQWKEGLAAFGSMNAPNNKYIGTSWTTPQIFMRRWFYLGDLDENLFENLRLTIFHDDDMDVYINGVPAAKRGGYMMGYSNVEIFPDALAALKPNAWNLIAVAGRQGSGEQIMDVGISAIVEADFDYEENFDDIKDVEYTDFTEPEAVQAPKFSKLSQEFRHTADRNNVVWADLDNDGKLEVAYTGRNSHSTTAPNMSVIYKNNGNDSFSEQNNPLANCFFSCPVAIDYDNDGNVDLFIPGLKTYNYSNGIEDKAAFLFHNNGNGKFEEVNQATVENNLMGLLPLYNDMGGGRGRHWVAVGDYDNDGFQDIVITGRDDYEFTDEEGETYVYSDKRAVYLFHNEGGNGFKLIENPLDGQAPFARLACGSVYFADMDNDALLDIVASGYGVNEGNLRVYWNNGDGTFSEERQVLSGSYNSSVAVGDFDNDGLQDILVTGYSGVNGGNAKSVFIYRNLGERLFTLMQQSDCGFEGVDGALPALGDINNNGKLDIILGGHSDTSGHEITSWAYMNKGDFSFTPTMTYFNDVKGTNSFARVSHGNNHLVDYNGDGFLDAWLMGWTAGGCNQGSDCLTVLYKNNTAAEPNAAPAKPENIKVAYNNETGVATFSWSAPEDDTTPSQALRYNLYVRKKGSDKIAAVLPVTPETGFIKTDELTSAITTNYYSMRIPLEDADYEWGVQAIDNGKAAGVFAKGEFNPSSAGVGEIVVKKHNKISLEGSNLHYSLSPDFNALSIYNDKGIKVFSATNATEGVAENLPEGILVVRFAGPKSLETQKLLVAY